MTVVCLTDQPDLEKPHVCSTLPFLKLPAPCNDAARMVSTCTGPLQGPATSHACHVHSNSNTNCTAQADALCSTCVLTSTRHLL